MSGYLSALLYYGGISSLVVILVFLIILNLSRPINQLWFAYYFEKLRKKLSLLITPYVKELFLNLDDVVSCDPELAKSGRIRVLEIGAGSGPNFPYYPSNCNLVTTDVNISFKKYRDDNKKRFQDGVLHENHIQAYGEDMSVFPSNSIDVVVCTYVLCSVRDVQQTLKEIKRVLKKGGKFIYFEHVSNPRGSLIYHLQNLFNPLWKTINAGCHITRFAFEHIQRAGFSQVSNKQTILPYGTKQGLDVWIISKMVRLTDYGVAIK